MTCTCCHGACCNGSTCTITTRANCSGIWAGVGTTCSAGQCPRGACCYGGTNYRCTGETTQAACNAIGGTFLADETCESAAFCFPGACCVSGTCSVTTKLHCEKTLGGVFQGAATTCSGGTCLPRGACCTGVNSCTSNLTQTECSNIGGSWQGANTTCQTTGICSCTSSTPALPIAVYRTGGLPVPSGQSTGCATAFVGNITTTNGSVTVSSGLYNGNYSSVETQAVDACGRCVYYGNKAVSGGGTASITVTYGLCAVGFPFGGGGSWCNNYMCNPLP